MICVCVWPEQVDGLVEGWKGGRMDSTRIFLYGVNAPAPINKFYFFLAFLPFARACLGRIYIFFLIASFRSLSFFFSSFLPSILLVFLALTHLTLPLLYLTLPHPTLPAPGYPDHLRLYTAYIDPSPFNHLFSTRHACLRTHILLS